MVSDLLLWWCRWWECGGGSGFGFGGVEFEDLHWGELKEGLGDVVLQWNDDAM